MNNQIQPASRHQPLPSELEKLVADQIEKHVQAQDTFTAYGITKELRTAHPDLEIIHQDVRFLVHSQMMNRIVVNGLAYNDQPELMPDGNTATNYYPAINAIGLNSKGISGTLVLPAAGILPAPQTPVINWPVAAALPTVNPLADLSKGFLIKTDGTIQEVKPANGTDFTRQEIYATIGCTTFEIAQTKDDRILLCDEEGLLVSKDINAIASALSLGGMIVGDVILCPDSFVK